MGRLLLQRPNSGPDIRTSFLPQLQVPCIFVFNGVALFGFVFDFYGMHQGSLVEFCGFGNLLILPLSSLHSPSQGTFQVNEEIALIGHCTITHPKQKMGKLFAKYALRGRDKSSQKTV